MSPRIRIPYFSLKHTLECGQFFRFTKVGDTYLVQASDQIFSLWQKGDFLYYRGTEESFLRQFFRLDDDFNSILKEINRDPVIRQAIRQFPGLRLIRQDPWECLLSFLCSSAKSIPQIKSMIEGLCKSSGKRNVWENHIGYGFPKPNCMETPLQLQPIKAGFRTNYLFNANRCVDQKQLHALKSLPYREARKTLMNLSGVGKKVADCVLLYSLDFLESFPMDTWIKKGLQRDYLDGKRVGEKALESFLSQHFGPYAGYAQLYLYHYWRNQPLKVE